MDVDLIRTFVQVAKTLHFRNAAEQLYLTPSAVSARIRLLEERLGVRLFERNKHGVSLTTSGVRFLTHAETLLTSWRAACNDVRRPEGAISSLVVGATDTMWSMFLNSWLDEFNQTHPSWMLRADLHTMDTLVPALLDGSIDLAVMFDAPALPRLYLNELGVVSIRMVSDHPGLDAETVGQCRYVDVDWGEAFAMARQAHFEGLNAMIRTSVGKVALDLLLRSGGTAYLPQPMVEEALRTGRLFPVEHMPVIERPVYAAMLTGREGEAAFAEGISLMRGMLEQTSRCR